MYIAKKFKMLQLATKIPSVNEVDGENIKAPNHRFWLRQWEGTGREERSEEGEEKGEILCIYKNSLSPGRSNHNLPDNSSTELQASRHLPHRNVPVATYRYKTHSFFHHILTKVINFTNKQIIHQYNS